MSRIRWMWLVLPLALALNAKVVVPSFDHSGWDHLLKQHVDQAGEVDYASIRASRDELDAYIGQLAQASPDSRPELFPSKEHALAYWLNAYNAFTVKGVVDQYPARSVRDLGVLRDSFRNQEHIAGGKAVTLNHIEHVILRKRFQDPRIHFAIGYAAASSPSLARDAYAAVTLDAQLDRVTSEFVNGKLGMRIDSARNEIRLSKIFDWYRQDFEIAVRGRGGRALLSYVQSYAGATTQRALEQLANPKVRFQEYDWALNDSGSLAAAKAARDPAPTGRGI